MTMILWVTFFTSSIVLVVVDDGDSMLATSAFLILHDHSATAAAIADADVSVFLGLRRYLSSFFLPVSWQSPCVDAEEYWSDKMIILTILIFLAAPVCCQGINEPGEYFIIIIIFDNPIHGYSIVENISLTFVGKIKFLIQPKLMTTIPASSATTATSNEKLNFLFLIHSSQDNASRRSAIRSTWASLQQVHEHKVQFVFCIRQQENSSAILQKQRKKKMRSPKMAPKWQTFSDVRKKKFLCSPIPTITHLY